MTDDTKWYDKINLLRKKHNIACEIFFGEPVFSIVDHPGYGKCPVWLAKGGYESDYKDVMEWLQKNGLEQ